MEAMSARPILLSKKQPSVDFETFFRSEYPTLVRMLFLLTGGSAEAEDLAQEALARAFERWKRVRGMDSPGGYVYRIAVNLNRKRLRRLGVRARTAVRLPAHSDPITAAEQRSDVARALAALPVRQRESLVLTEWLDLTAEEAGRILRIEAGTVRSNATRARVALREQLEDRDE